jgi:hypothetical protein
MSDQPFAQAMPLLEVVQRVLGQPHIAAMVMRETFQPIDALLYAIAGYEGYRLVLLARR